MASIGVSVKFQATIHAGKYLAAGTLVLIMLFHLVLLQGGATRITSKEHHSTHLFHDTCTTEEVGRAYGPARNSVSRMLNNVTESRRAPPNLLTLYYWFRLLLFRLVLFTPAIVCQYLYVSHCQYFCY